MRKAMISMMAAGLVLGLFSGPASAKTVRKSFSLTAPAPAPVLTDVDPDGCLNTQEDVNRDTFTFKAPKHRKTGKLSVRIDGFTGDWDLFVLKGSSVIAESTSDNLSQDYEAVTLSGIKGGTKLDIVGCNWSGSPQANGSLVYKHR